MDVKDPNIKDGTNLVKANTNVLDSSYSKGPNKRGVLNKHVGLLFYEIE